MGAIFQIFAPMFPLWIISSNTVAFLFPAVFGVFLFVYFVLFHIKLKWIWIIWENTFYINLNIYRSYKTPCLSPFVCAIPVVYSNPTILNSGFWGSSCLHYHTFVLAFSPVAIMPFCSPTLISRSQES